MRQLATRYSLLATRAASDLAVTLGGRTLQMLLALAGNVISARALGPTDLGRFGLVITTVMICGTIADAGLTHTAIKFIAQNIERDPDAARATGRTYFLLRLLTGALVAAVGLLLSWPIAALLLGYPDLTPYLQLAFFTLLGLSLSSYPNMVLVALSSFRRLGAAGILNATITLAGIAALLASGNLNLGTLIAWNVALPIASSIPAWLLIPREWLPWQPQFRIPHPALRIGEMLNFSKWMGLATLGSIIATQADLILLGRFATPATVGVYSVALALAMRMDALNQSLFLVLMPRASRLQGPAQIRWYSRRVLRGSLLLAALLGVAALLAQPLIILLYGETYLASAGLFLALMAVVLFDLATSSLFLVALPLNKPRVWAVAEWLRVAVLAGAGWLLIPLYSGMGAAAARFLSRVAGALYALTTLRRATDHAQEQDDGLPHSESGPAPAGWFPHSD